MTDAAKLKNAAELCISNGAIDLNTTVIYTSVKSWFNIAGVPDKVDYDKLEQAARNVMRERESGGFMLWEIPIDKFADEYVKLVNEAG